MTFEDLESSVLDWARDRGILQNGTPVSQLLKAVSELGELCDAEGKKNKVAIQDGIGDVLVCLINYAALHGLRPVDCLLLAYCQIRDRKGWLMPDGTFVKEG